MQVSPRDVATARVISPRVPEREKMIAVRKIRIAVDIFV